MGFTFYHLGVLPGVPSGKMRIDYDGLTVRQFILRLADNYQSDFSYELKQLESKEDGELRMVTIDGVNIDTLDGLDTVITENCTLVMSSIIAGG